MWLSRQMKAPAPTADADLGMTTITGDSVGVVTRGEVRALPVYVIWPRQGFCQGVMIERRIRIPLQKGARYGMIQKPTKKQKGEREN